MREDPRSFLPGPPPSCGDAGLKDTARPGALGGILGRLPVRQFARYLVVGGLSTATDWGVFYLLAMRLDVHYQVAVIASLAAAFVVHFTLNKLYTFRCTSRQLVRQILLHLVVSAIYTGLSVACMYAMVDLLRFGKMPSKMLTTGAMMVISYLLSKALTFNERLLR